MNHIIFVLLLLFLLNNLTVTGNTLLVPNYRKIAKVNETEPLSIELSKNEISIVTNSIHKYLTKDNITLAIALLGAFGNIGTWIFNYLHSRRNISIQIIKICRIPNALIAYSIIQNHSRNPISINDISIKTPEHLYTSNNVPQIPFQRGYDHCSITRKYISMPFPVNLGSLSGASGYIYFEIPSDVSENLSAPLTVQISTNRGNSFQMKLVFDTWTPWDEML